MKSPEEEEKYNKNAKPQPVMLPGDTWSKYEFTKYFDALAMFLMSGLRFFLGSKPVAAQYMFPIISLKLYGFKPLIVIVS